MNIAAIEDLHRQHPNLDLIFIESGGDNLAATFSPDLVDYWIFVIDVAAGDDIPRKRGLGTIKADLLLVNKVDLAPHVGADLDRMRRDVAEVRGGRPYLFTNLRGEGGAVPVYEALKSGAFTGGVGVGR